MIQFSSIQRILVCKLRHHGDVLLTSPVFTVLKKVMPDAKIDALIYLETAPILEGHRGIDRVITYDKGWKDLPFLKRYWHEWRLLKKVHNNHYDLVINLTDGDRGAIIAWWSKAKYRVGIESNEGMWGKAFCYTHLTKKCPTMRHTVEMNLDVLRGIGIIPSPQDKELVFHIDKKIEEGISQSMESPFVVVHPVSRWMFKSTRIDLIKAAIDHLQKKGLKVILTGSSQRDEMIYNQKLAELCPGVIHLSGKISLKELGALIKNAKLLLCVDSLPMHLGSVFKTPLIALFGPTSEQRWAPWMHPYAEVLAQNFSCRPCYRPGCGDSHYSDCLMTLSEDQLLQAIDQKI